MPDTATRALDTFPRLLFYHAQVRGNKVAMRERIWASGNPGPGPMSPTASAPWRADSQRLASSVATTSPSSATTVPIFT